MLDLDPSLSTRARLHHRLLLPWLLAIAACQGKDGLLTEFTSDSTSGSGTSTSTSASTGSTTGTTGDLTSSGSDGATAATTATDAGTTMAGDPTSSSGETTSTGDSSTADPGASDSGTTGEGFCQSNLDCDEGLWCAQTCTDDCDQSMFPNPCCERLCVDFEPRACEVIGGLCQSTCGPGRYPAANAEVWTCFAFSTACCLPEVDSCADHPGRVFCESEVGCEWVLADCGIENCNDPDKGTCQPV